MKTVTLLDYGSGNLHSVRRALEYLGAAVLITSDQDVAAKADRLIIPGVGAFGESVSKLTSTGLKQAIIENVNRGTPILGICVGMQILFTSSVEFGHHEGLGIIPGQNLLLNPRSADGEALKVPHIGWSELQQGYDRSWSGTILEGIHPGTRCYFVHSFAPHADVKYDVLAETHYADVRFCSVVNRGNVWGCQFHPEKSGPKGLTILDAFLRQ